MVRLLGEDTMGIADAEKDKNIIENCKKTSETSRNL
jgi:hypothetical protein